MSLPLLRFQSAIAISILTLITSAQASTLEISSVNVVSIVVNDSGAPFVPDQNLPPVPSPSPINQSGSFVPLANQQSGFNDDNQEPNLPVEISSLDDDFISKDYFAKGRQEAKRSKKNQFEEITLSSGDRVFKVAVVENGIISVAVDQTNREALFTQEPGMETNLCRYAINMKGFKAANRVEVSREGVVKIVAVNSTPAVMNKDLPPIGANPLINTDVGYNPHGAGTNLPPFDGDDFGMGTGTLPLSMGNPEGGAGADLPPDDGDSNQDNPLDSAGMAAKLALHENFYVRHTLNDSGRFCLNRHIEIDFASFKARIFQKIARVAYYLAQAPPANIQNLLIQVESRVYFKKTNPLQIGLSSDSFYSQKDLFYQSFLAPPDQVPKAI